MAVQRFASNVRGFISRKVRKRLPECVINTVTFPAGAFADETNRRFAMKP